MKLGMFYWPCGHHIAAWRHPDGVADSGANLAHLVEIARLAERGLFDMFFMADSVSFWRGSLESMTRDSYGTWIEPFTLMCALAQHTTHLGLVCTATTTYDQPYALARRFASLDLVSGGRAGWNLVTSANRSEADSFGLGRARRKIRALPTGAGIRPGGPRAVEFVGRGRLRSEQEGRVYFDRNRVQIMEHAGEFFRVRGPLNVPPSPQGEPVLVQAGASDDGRALAAETAEVIFGAQQTLAGAQAFYADVKARAAACGRDPDGIKIMPGLLVAPGRTHDEAVDKYEALQDLIDPLTGLQLLSQRLDYDVSGYPLTGRCPISRAMRPPRPGWICSSRSRAGRS